MKNENGITLIALIITIIVMVILTGVAINGILSSNGIIRNTEIAVQNSKEATIKEEIQIAYLSTKTIKDEEEFVTKFGEKLNTTVIDNGNEYELTYKGYDAVVSKETGAVTLVQTGEKEPEITVNWLYTTKTDGSIELTGINYEGLDYIINTYESYDTISKTYTVTTKTTTINLGNGILKIPSTIDGKTVTSININSEVAPSELEDVTITLTGITGISLPNTVINIENAAFQKFSYDSRILNFNSGKNSELEVPDNEWYAKKITIRGVEYGLEYTSSANENELMWIYKTNAEGGAIIIGMDFSNCEYTKTSNGLYTYDVDVKLNTTTLQIPTTIDGYTVVALRLEDEVAPSDVEGVGEWSNDITITDVTQINIPITVKNIKSTAFSNFNCSTLILNFNQGTHPKLTVPDNKWNVNKIIIDGSEYNAE